MGDWEGRLLDRLLTGGRDASLEGQPKTRSNCGTLAPTRIVAKAAKGIMGSLTDEHHPEIMQPRVTRSKTAAAAAAAAKQGKQQKTEGFQQQQQC
eukprot:635765-Pelagomonas_calceolata.AAC.1